MRNTEIVIYALYLKGGAGQFVNTEDIAICSHQLAPHSFSWVKYPKYPDKEVVRRELIRARKVGAHALVTGRTGKASRGKSVDGWTLTPEGVEWIKLNQSRLAQALETGVSKPHRQEILRSLQRVRSHRLFKQFLEQGKEFNPRPSDVAELVRCRVDAESEVWRRRFDGLRAQALSVGQNDILEFVKLCAAQVDDTLVNS